jgi:hypothetical protein
VLDLDCLAIYGRTPVANLKVLAAKIQRDPPLRCRIATFVRVCGDLNSYLMIGSQLQTRGDRKSRFEGSPTGHNLDFQRL